MKPIIQILLVMTISLLPACSRPQERVKTSNATYDIDLLFSHEGTKVYRFFDNGTWVYYAVPESGEKIPIKVWVPPKPEKDESTDTEAPRASKP